MLALLRHLQAMVRVCCTVGSLLVAALPRQERDCLPSCTFFAYLSVSFPPFLPTIIPVPHPLTHIHSRSIQRIAPSLPPSIYNSVSPLSPLRLLTSAIRTSSVDRTGIVSFRFSVFISTLLHRNSSSNTPGTRSISPTFHTRKTIFLHNDLRQDLAFRLRGSFTDDCGAGRPAHHQPQCCCPSSRFLDPRSSRSSLCRHRRGQDDPEEADC